MKRRQQGAFDSHAQPGLVVGIARTCGRLTSCAQPGLKADVLSPRND